MQLSLIFSPLQPGVAPPRVCSVTTLTLLGAPTGVLFWRRCPARCLLLILVVSCLSGTDTTEVPLGPLGALFQGHRMLTCPRYSRSLSDDLVKVPTSRFLYCSYCFPLCDYSALPGPPQSLSPRPPPPHPSEPAFLSCGQELGQQRLLTVRGQGRPRRTFAAGGQ